MKHSYRYFTNKECNYYPCHVGMEELNCLFCFCPLYSHEACPGTAEYIESEGKMVKDCSKCTFPHEAESYEVIIKLLSAGQ